MNKNNKIILLIFLLTFSLNANNKEKIQSKVELIIQQGQKNSIKGALLSKDEKYFFSYSEDHIIKVWNWKDGKLLQTLEGHTNKIKGIQLNQDESLLISYADDNIIKFWNWKEGKLFKNLNKSDLNIKQKKTLRMHDDRISGIQLTLDESKLISYSSDEIKVWDWKEEKLLSRLLIGHSKNITGIQLTKDKKWLFTCSDDKTIRVWNFQEKMIYKILKSHEDGIKGILLANDDSNLISYSRDNTIKIWDWQKGKVIKNLIGHEDVVNEVNLIDEDKIISYSNDRTIKIWNWKEGILLKTLVGHTGKVKGIFLLQSKTGLISYSDDNTIKLWDYSNKMSGEDTIDPLATFISFKDNSWMYYTPDNYYMISGESALDYISFKKEDEFYNFDQFDIKFNRPDIILERVKNIFLNQKQPEENEESYQSRIQEYDNRTKLLKNYYENRVLKNGFELSQLSGENKIHAPEIFDVKIDGEDVESDDFNFTSLKSKINLSFQIRDEKKSNLNVIGYSVFVKGVPIRGQFMKKFPKLQKIQKVEEEIVLSTEPDLGDDPGDNSIEIIGYTVDGVQSNQYKIEMKYKFKERNKRKLYLVTLGTNKYKSGGQSDLNDLSFSVDDTKDIQKLFDKESKSFDQVIKIHFTDEEISRDSMKKIRDSLKDSDVDDTIVFFISGHGVRANTSLETVEKLKKELNLSQEIGDLTQDKNSYNIYYYMSWNSNSKTPYENGIPMESFRYALEGVKSRQKILLIDTCQSGDVVELAGYNPSKERVKEIRKLREKYQKEVSTKGIDEIEILAERGQLDTEPFFKRLALEWELKEIARLFPELRRGNGTIEISAASGTQAALESKEWKNGAFTFTIKEAILDGKAKEGKSITAKSLRKYVLDRVERLTKGRQVPMVTRDIQGRDFEVVK